MTCTQHARDNDVAWTCHDCGCETLTDYTTTDAPRCHACGNVATWPDIHDDNNTVGPAMLTGVGPYDLRD